MIPMWHLAIPRWLPWAALGLVLVLAALAWWRPDWACMALAAVLGMGGAQVARRPQHQEPPEPSTEEHLRRVLGATERVRAAGEQHQHPPEGASPEEALQAMRARLTEAGIEEDR